MTTFRELVPVAPALRQALLDRLLIAAKAPQFDEPRVQPIEQLLPLCVRRRRGWLEARRECQSVALERGGPFVEVPRGRFECLPLFLQRFAARLERGLGPDGSVARLRGNLALLLDCLIAFLGGQPQVANEFGVGCFRIDLSE